MIHMNIRKYVEKDIPSIVLLLKELSEVADPTHFLTCENVQKICREMDPYPEMYKNYIAECEDEIIGFMSLIFYKTVFHKGGIVLINELIVKSGFRGKGVGTGLIEKARELSIENRMDDLEVGTKRENIKARDFYKKSGFSHEFVLFGMDLL
ncbi:MAG: GNAT family N-acetyltransferase [Spirochaetales bacterium]|nr:GNAT family N-acetyltransferase [Spirochaetales bacterium]